MYLFKCKDLFQLFKNQKEMALWEKDVLMPKKCTWRNETYKIGKAFCITNCIKNDTIFSLYAWMLNTYFRGWVVFETEFWWSMYVWHMVSLLTAFVSNQSCLCRDFKKCNMIGNTRLAWWCFVKLLWHSVQCCAHFKVLVFPF